MSINEAIEYMGYVKNYCDAGDLPEQYIDAIRMAIEALKEKSERDA